MTMNRQTFAAALEVGLRKTMMQSFRAKAEMWKILYNMDSMTRASIDDVGFTDFGPMQEGTELGGYTYDDALQGFRTTYTPVKYQKAFKISEEMLEDDQNNLMRRYPAALGRSIRHTLETTHWDKLNNAFDSAFPGGDGKELLATDHPLVGGGTQANELTVAANLSPESIEDAITAIGLTVDDRGKFINLMPDKLFVPWQLWAEARRIDETTKEVGTANNTINVIAGMFPGGIHPIPYLTSTKAWFIQCDQHEMWHFWRQRVKFGFEDDFDTDAYKYKSRGRWTSGFSSPWGMFGSPGV